MGAHMREVGRVSTHHQRQLRPSLSQRQIVDRARGNHRVSIDMAKQVKDGGDVYAGQAVLTRSLTKTVRDGVGRTLSPETLVPMLWGRAMTNWDLERRLACGLVCS